MTQLKIHMTTRHPEKQGILFYKIFFSNIFHLKILTFPIVEVAGGANPFQRAILPQGLH